MSWSLLKATNLLSMSACILAGEMAHLATSGRLGLLPSLSSSLLLLVSSLLELLLEELVLVDSPGKFASDASCMHLSLAIAAVAIKKA